MVARITGVLAAAVLVQAANTEGDFQQAVAPLLAGQCSACHSEKLKTSGFSVASVESVIAGGNKHGKAVIGGHPEQSPLVRILKGELQPRMPFGKTLDKADIARIEDWIRSLPPDLGADQGAAKVEWRWPFEKPVKRVPPAVKDAAWVANPIDAFILGKLEERGLKPAPSASRRTLARRVYYGPDRPAAHSRRNEHLPGG
jgi:mono/diheme cytochrome c family protein